MPRETLEKIEHYSDVLRLKQSTLCSMILQDKLEEWVKEYAEKIFVETSELRREK